MSWVLQLIAAAAILALCIWLDESKQVRRKKPEKEDPPTFI